MLGEVGAFRIKTSGPPRGIFCLPHKLIRISSIGKDTYLFPVVNRPYPFIWIICPVCSYHELKVGAAGDNSSGFSLASEVGFTDKTSDLGLY